MGQSEGASVTGAEDIDAEPALTEEEEDLSALRDRRRRDKKQQHLNVHERRRVTCSRGRAPVHSPLPSPPPDVIAPAEVDLLKRGVVLRSPRKRSLGNTRCCKMVCHTRTAI